MRHERGDSLLGRCTFPCFFFLVFFSVWPACQISADAKSCRKVEGANCRYTRQGLTNLRVNKLRV